MQHFSRRSFLKTTAAGLCTAGLPFSGFGQQSHAGLASELAAHNHAVLDRSSWIRDPFVTRARNGLFYLTGTTQPPSGTDDVSRDVRNPPPGDFVRVWSSADLVSWQNVGPIVSLKDMASYTTERATFNANPEAEWHVWAPELHQRADGRWGLVFTIPPPLRPKVGAALMLSATNDLHGPWSNPMGANVGLRHDPSLFCDDDGTWWMIWGNTAIAPLKPDWSGYAAEPLQIHPSDAVAMGHEGCTIQKIEGKYVLFGTGWSTSKWRKGSYNLYYATADKVTGPYGKRRLLGRFMGHGTPFQDKQGKWWCTAFPNANDPAISADGIEHRDLSHGASTINPEGLTLVPLSVEKVKGDVEIRALDPRYSTPGPDEAATWTGKITIGQPGSNI